MQKTTKKKETAYAKHLDTHSISYRERRWIVSRKETYIRRVEHNDIPSHFVLLFLIELPSSLLREGFTGSVPFEDGRVFATLVDGFDGCFVPVCFGEDMRLVETPEDGRCRGCDDDALHVLSTKKKAYVAISDEYLQIEDAYPYLYALCRIPVVPFKAGSMSSTCQKRSINQHQLIEIISKPTFGLLCVEMEWRSGMRDSVYAFHGIVKRAFFLDILDHDQLQPVSVFFEYILEMRALGGRANSSANGVPRFEEKPDEPDCDESVGARDEDF